MLRYARIRLLGYFTLLFIISLGTISGCEKNGGDNFLCTDVSGKLMNPGNQLDYSGFRDAVDGLVNGMTLDEKLWQMILADLTFIQDMSGNIDFSLISEFHLGGLLIDANVVTNGEGSISTNFLDEDLYLNGTMANWQELIGTDNIHGNQHVVGEILVPHNIGLAATHDPEIICATAFFNAYSVIESGVNWGYSPTIEIGRAHV